MGMTLLHVVLVSIAAAVVVVTTRRPAVRYAAFGAAVVAGFLLPLTTTG